MTWSVAKSPRVSKQRDVNIHSLTFGDQDGTLVALVSFCQRWRVRRTDVVDRIHLSAPLHVWTGKLCSWQSVPSRTIAQHIESVTHHSVSARTIRRRLQQSGLSARRLLLGLPLTQNHRRLRRQCAMKEGCGWKNGMKLSLLTSHASVCNTTMVGFESGDTVERGC
ncbi:HTH_38 domain-containing protein [Trichonephila clavipes]|nr:HTH_38 domain-containing protein [Trichonephila clavipes]